MGEQRIQQLEQRISDLEETVKQLSEQALTKGDQDAIIKASLREAERQQRQAALVQTGNPTGGRWRRA